jgi:hypothetical protein
VSAFAAATPSKRWILDCIGRVVIPREPKAVLRDPHRWSSTRSGPMPPFRVTPWEGGVLCNTTLARGTPGSISKYLWACGDAESVISLMSSVVGGPEASPPSPTGRLARGLAMGRDIGGWETWQVLIRLYKTFSTPGFRTYFHHQHQQHRSTRQATNFNNTYQQLSPTSTHQPPATNTPTHQTNSKNPPSKLQPKLSQWPPPRSSSPAPPSTMAAPATTSESLLR